MVVEECTHLGIKRDSLSKSGHSTIIEDRITSARGCAYSLMGAGLQGPYNYQNALYTGKHFYLPKSTEKTYARRGLYVLWITILCVLDNKDACMWQEKVYNP